MMNNRAPRQLMGGSGLLGEGPGMRRMMAGAGAGGLLGKAPTENRMHQPRSLMERPDMSGGMRNQNNMRGGLVEQPHRQEYNHGGRMEEPVDPVYYDEPVANYREDNRSYGVGAGGLLGNAPVENRMHQSRPLMDRPDMSGGLRKQTNMHGGIMEQPNLRDRQGYSHGGRMEEPADVGYYDEARTDYREDDRAYRQEYPEHNVGAFDQVHDDPYGEELRNSQDQGGFMNLPRDQPSRPAGRNQQGFLDQPREHGYMESVHDHQGLMEIPGLDMHTEQRGLLNFPRDQPRGLMDLPSIMDIPEPPRPPRSLMDARNEPRGLMDTPVEPRRLMETGRDQKKPNMQQMQQRGNRGQQQKQQQQQRGLLDTPREQRVPMSPKQQNNRNRPRTKQSELMEKADLQMKLLQQEKMREMEQLEQMNLLKQQQQALLLQQQQQHLQQHQQLQQQMQIKQQMQQAEIIMNASKGQQRSPGAIPSLFDVPTSRAKTSLGKRPSAPVRTTDSKRVRSGPADRRERRLSQQGRNDSSPRDRLGGRQNDRNSRNRRGGRKLMRKSSPDRKGRDRRASDSRDGSSKKSTPSRGDKGKERRNDRSKDKGKNEKASTKEKPTTEVTITVGDEKYDPAEPTEDIDMPETQEDKTVEGGDVEKMDTGENKESKDVETKQDDREGDQKPKEISLTVTVNKKGRSVNDADKDDCKKPNREKQYKCNICSVSCYDEASFSRHMSGKKHGDKMKIVMSSTSHQTELIKSRLQAEEHLRQIESQKRTPVKLGPTGAAGPKGKALETLCKVCEKNFTGAYKDHKESPDHKAKEDRSKAGCKICKVSTFNTYDAFTKHLQSVWHRKKLKQDSWPECKLCDQKFKSPRKFVQHCKTDHHIQNKKKLNSEDDDEEISDLVTLDTVGFDDDTNAEKKEKEMETDTSFTKPLEASTPVPKPTEKPAKDESSTPVKAGLFTQKSDEQTPSKVEEEDTEVPDTYDPTLALGQKYVVPVSGFFCKLCHKFYNNESAAKVAHCQSETHFEKLKKAIAAKLLKTKKKEVSQPTSGDSGTSQSNEIKNGNQSEDVITIDEQSQGETADETYETDVSQEDGETTLEDTDTTDKQSEVASPIVEIASPVVEVKKPTARRGGITTRGVPRARRGRK